MSDIQEFVSEHELLHQLIRALFINENEPSIEKLGAILLVQSRTLPYVKHSMCSKGLHTKLVHFYTRHAVVVSDRGYCSYSAVLLENS